MSNPEKLKQQFWKALDSEQTVMLALSEAEEAHGRPMTAQIEDDGPPIWFFTSSEASLAEHVEAGEQRATLMFVSKGHDLFATVHGQLVVDSDRGVVDRLWNPFVAAWYKGGKEDPSLRLLRFDPDDGEIWENSSSVFAGLKLLFGSDPKKDFKEKVAKVDLS